MAEFDPSKPMFKPHGTHVRETPPGYVREGNLAYREGSRPPGWRGRHPGSLDIVPLTEEVGIKVYSAEEAQRAEEQDRQDEMTRGYGKAVVGTDKAKTQFRRRATHHGDPYARDAQEAQDAGEASKKAVPDTPKKTSSKADKKLDRYANFEKKQPRAQAVAKAVGGMGKKDSTNGQRYKPASDGVDAAFDRIIDTLTMRRSAK